MIFKDLVDMFDGNVFAIRYKGDTVYARDLSQARYQELCKQRIRGIALHSGRVKSGYVFFALNGTLRLGGSFIKEALRNGAHVLVIEKTNIGALPRNAAVIIVRDCRIALGLAVNAFFNFPQKKINTTAITGTNGKTTITYLLENIFAAWHKDAGVIGTINYRYGNKVFPAPNTTPDIVTTFEFIDKMVKKDVGFLFMEVSSHALKQKRVEGLRFDQAVFTNLGREHFDYHKTLSQYFNAKSMLFNEYLRPQGRAIINSDDVYGARLAQRLKRTNGIDILTYGIKNNADVAACDISYGYDGISMMVRYARQLFHIKTNLMGECNVYNILASIAVCLRLRVPQASIMQGLTHVVVPGRLERVPGNKAVRIFVDYAHTADALKHVLKTMRLLKKEGRLILVFGCGGDRDKTKRAPMGRVASTFADVVIVTSDNPRSENPMNIIKDIKRGMVKKKYLCIVNRKQAIKKAIAMAQNGDIIIIAGKGHENYQIIKNKKIAFCDRAIVKNLLSQRGPH